MAEEATKVEETIQEEVKQKLNNPLTDYLTKVSSEKKEEKKEEQQTQKKNYDYSFFKDIDDKDYKTIDDYLKENKIESDDVRYKIATLTNDFKKQQRMASQRLAEVEGLKSKLQSSEGASHKDFIDSLRKDPIGAFKRYKDEYDLPDFDFIQHQMESGGDIETRLEKWQNETLLKEIEKKFGIPADEFVFDPSEAKRANTPSRYYEKRTSQKEKELNDEFDNFQKKRKDADEKIIIERVSKIAKFRPDDISPLKAAKNIHIPVLIVHGNNDNKINPVYANELFLGLASNNKRILIIPGASHLDVWNKGGVGYFAEVDKFLNTAVLNFSSDE